MDDIRILQVRWIFILTIMVAKKKSSVLAKSLNCCNVENWNMTVLLRIALWTGTIPKMNCEMYHKCDRERHSQMIDLLNPTKNDLDWFSELGLLISTSNLSLLAI